jgi:hypothetical protein
MSKIVSDNEILSFLGFPASTVDQDSVSGQKVLYILDTINFEIGDEVVAGRGTIRNETKVIDTIQNGISLTMTENLVYTHLEINADTIETSIQDAAMISTLNLAVDKQVKNYCARNFNEEIGHIEYCDGDGGNEILLEDYPVSSVLMYIKSDTEEEFDDDEDLIDSEDYVFYPDIGLIHYYGQFPDSHRSIKFVYTRGYSDDDMPEDLKLVCKVEVKNNYERMKENTMNLKSNSLAGMSKSYQEGLFCDFSKNILDGFYVKKRA